MKKVCLVSLFLQTVEADILLKCQQHLVETPGSQLSLFMDFLDCIISHVPCSFGLLFFGLCIVRLLSAQRTALAQLQGPASSSESRRVSVILK